MRREGQCGLPPFGASYARNPHAARRPTSRSPRPAGENVKDVIVGIALVAIVGLGFYFTKGGGGPPGGPNDPAFRIGPYGRVGDEPGERERPG